MSNLEKTLSRVNSGAPYGGDSRTIAGSSPNSDLLMMRAEMNYNATVHLDIHSFHSVLSTQWLSLCLDCHIGGAPLQESRYCQQEGG